MNIFSLFEHLPLKVKAILLGAIAFAIASTPACIAVIVANSGSISVKHQDTEINLQGKTKALVNDAEYSNKILQQKLNALEAEINQIKSPELAGVKESFAELKPTADQAYADNQELTEVVDSATIN
jgi:phosphate-selective porin